MGSSQNEPAAKDPLSQKVSLDLSNQTVFDGVAKLSQNTDLLGFAIERELTKKKRPKLPPVIRFTATIADVSIRDALIWLCSLDPRYTWTFSDGIVNLFPADVVDDNTYPLNREIESAEFHDIKTVSAAVVAAAEHANPPQQIAILHLGRTDFDKPINLTLNRVTLRDALDRIAKKLGPTYTWQFSGTEDFHYIVFHDRLVPSPAPSK